MVPTTNWYAGAGVMPRYTAYKVASMRSSAKAAIAAAKNVISFPLTRGRREADELAFLPAALEIVETPPSPIGRAIAGVIALLFCAALAWAWWGTIDIVASATG